MIPCKNEAGSIAHLVSGLLNMGVEQVVVSIDPSTTDTTADTARNAGADVVIAQRSGYDGPVLDGIRAVEPSATHVLFLDAGGKYELESLADLLGTAHPDSALVYGVRDAQQFWHQRLGNLLFASILKVRFRSSWVADVSSVRLIRAEVIANLKLEDRMFSIPFQTTVHAMKQGLTIDFIPLRCTPMRVGISKVSGSHRNSARAAIQMLLSITKAPRFDQLPAKAAARRSGCTRTRR